MANLSRMSMDFGGLLTTPAETKIPAARAWACSNVDVETGVLRARRGYTLYGARASANAGDLGWGLGYGRFTQDASQILSLTGSPTSGTLTLKWRLGSGAYATTGAINYSATAADVEAALVGLSSIKVGDVECTGGPWPLIPITVVWRKSYAGQAIPLIVLDTNSLGGGTMPSFSAKDKVVGGDQTEYLVAIQKNGETTVTMYSVTDSGATWTSVATGLSAGDWMFAQFGDRIYACNAVDGLHYKVLGGAWDGAASGGFAGGSAVDAPTRGFSTDNGYQMIDIESPSSPFPYFVSDNTVAAFQNTVAYTGFGTDPTYKGVGIGLGGIRLTLNADVANQNVAVEVTIPQVDASFNDVHDVTIYSDDGTTTYVEKSSQALSFTNAGSVVINTQQRVLSSEDAEYANPARAIFLFGNENRTGRATVTKVKFSFLLTGKTGKTITIVIKGGLSLMFADARLYPVILYPPPGYWAYAYSYMRASDRVESSLSQAQRPPVVNSVAVFTGWWERMYSYGSTALTNSDYINLYRKDKTGVWRLVSQASNDSSGAKVLLYDKYMERELATLPQYGDLSGGGPSSDSNDVSEEFSLRVLGVWKQSLVLGFLRQAWMSYQGIPGLFAPSPDDASAPAPDDTDETRGVTTYVSDDRSESVTGIVGEDSLYLVTPQSAYAVVGDRPAGSSFPRRLPTSRGGLGTRAQCAFGGGVQIASQDGIWYYSVGRGFNGQDNGALTRREETEEIRSTWTTFAASNASRIVLGQWNDETWAFNGTAYLMRSRSGRWSTGTFADSVKSVFASPYAGFKFLDSKGRIMTLSADYTTDNGTAIAWNYETGWLESERGQFKKIFMWGAGAPTLQVYWDDGAGSDSATFAKPASRVAISGLTIPPAFRFKLKFSGASASVTVESCSIVSEPAPGGWAN